MRDAAIGAVGGVVVLNVFLQHEDEVAGPMIRR
jgi:hypothetical protein